MSYEAMENDIRYFIEDELYDMKTYPDCYLEEDIVNNTKVLNNINDKDIEKISNMILDDEELNIELKNCIRYYIYHYNKESE